MYIKNQIRLSVIISLVLIAAISVSIILTYQDMQDLNQQESLAAGVVRGGYELTYLSNDYIINAEPRARIQWEERYASLQPVISQLKATNSQEAQSIEAIRDYNERIGILFHEIPEPGTLRAGATLFPASYQQVTWSRMNVLSQGMIYDAWSLRYLYNDDASEARYWNNILVLVLMATMLVIISVNYLLISRRFVQSIREVNAGSGVFATGNLDYRIPPLGTDEIGEIARGLNAMAGQLGAVTASRDELNREIEERKRAEEEVRQLNAMLEQRVRDRTLELELANEGLRESEEKFRVVFENANDAILLTAISPNGLPEKFIEVNETACRRMKYTRDEFLRLSLKDIDAPETWEKIQEHMKGLMEKGDATFEGVHVTKDGERIPVEISAHTFSLHGRDLILAHVRDITERKRAEEALFESEQELRAVFDAAQDGMLVVDPKTQRYVLANAAILKQTGYTEAELLSRSISDLHPPADLPYVIEQFGKLNRGLTNLAPNIPVQRKDGTVFFVDINSSMVTLQGRQYSLGIFRDITERKLAEEQIRASLNEKVVLLREVHHRVKNNLQIIISLLNLQSRYIGDEKSRQALRESQNRVRAMSHVHEKLYQSPDITKIDLDHYIRFLGDSLFQFYGMNGKGIVLTIRIQDISVDINTAIPVGLIVNELISNSLKHAFPDGKNKKITIAIQRQDGMLAIGYTDNGVGIPADFDWRNAKSLGLRLVCSLVDQLDGTIELDRSSGTAFTIVVAEKE